jgi:hypothetical protein
MPEENPIADAGNDSRTEVSSGSVKYPTRGWGDWGNADR